MVAAEDSEGKDTICGFSQHTLVNCTAQAKNLVGFGEASEANIKTAQEDSCAFSAIPTHKSHGGK